MRASRVNRFAHGAAIVRLDKRRGFAILRIQSHGVAVDGPLGEEGGVAGDGVRERHRGAAGRGGEPAGEGVVRRGQAARAR